jgi:hypothetical protein
MLYYDIIFFLLLQLFCLINLSRAIPLFVLHRQDWNLLRPLVNVRNQIELQDLTNAAVYIAGFTDNVIKQKDEYYDIIMDGIIFF